ALGVMGKGSSGPGHALADRKVAKREVSDNPLDGLGSGGGGRSYRAAPAPAAPVAATPPPPPARDEERAKAKGEKDDSHRGAARLTATFATASMTGLSSPDLLLAAVKARLATVDWAAVGARPGQLVL